jgi:hypothetical protein
VYFELWIDGEKKAASSATFEGQGRIHLVTLTKDLQK